MSVRIKLYPATNPIGSITHYAGLYIKATFDRPFNTDPGQVNRTSQTRRNIQYRQPYYLH